MDPGRLKSIPLFASLPQDDLKAICTFADEVSTPSGKELVKEDDYAYDFAAIEEGSAEVLRDGQRIAELGPGDVFGEMAVLEKTMRTASVTATSPMRLITLRHWDMKHMPEVAERLRGLVEERRQQG